MVLSLLLFWHFKFLDVECSQQNKLCSLNWFFNLQNIFISYQVICIFGGTQNRTNLRLQTYEKTRWLFPYTARTLTFASTINCYLGFPCKNFHSCSIYNSLFQSPCWSQMHICFHEPLNEHDLICSRTVFELFI